MKTDHCSREIEERIWLVELKTETVLTFDRFIMKQTPHPPPFPRLIQTEEIL